MVPVNFNNLVNGGKYLYYRSLWYKTNDGLTSSDQTINIFIYEYRDMGYPLYSLRINRDYTFDPYIIKSDRAMLLYPNAEYFELTDEEFLIHTVGESI